MIYNIITIPCWGLEFRIGGFDQLRFVSNSHDFALASGRWASLANDKNCLDIVNAMS